MSLAQIVVIFDCVLTGAVYRSVASENFSILDVLGFTVLIVNYGTVRSVHSVFGPGSVRLVISASYVRQFWASLHILVSDNFTFILRSCLCRFISYNVAIRKQELRKSRDVIARTQF